MAAWLYQPVMFQSSRAFDCEGFTPEQCAFYKEHWHNWYVADWTFSLPTVAFFMTGIGIFIIGYALTQLLPLSHRPGLPIWRRCVAATRYLSYRGFHIKSLGWNSAPVGVLFLGVVATIYFFCMELVPSPYYWPGTDTVWGNSPPLGTRSGWLALACMPFLFATASKANWISLVTGVPHEKLQIFHRWIAYAFMITALMHTFPFIVWHIRNHDMVNQFWETNIFEYWTGIVALLFQAWLTFASWGPIRNWGYEFFKAAHFFSAVVFMVVFFWHCGGTLTSWDYFVATAAIYVPCWTYPWLRTLFEYGIGQKAQIIVEDNDIIRVTIPANFQWRPGQHCFLRFRSFGIGALTSHPFTICSLPSTLPDRLSEIVFYIRPRGGFTGRLYKYATANPGVRIPVLVDGPYGGIDNQKYFSSDRLILVAGGSGAGWMLPFIEQFLRHISVTEPQNPQSLVEKEKETTQASDEPIRPRISHGPQTIRVILATRDIATRTWFHSAVNNLVSAYDSSGLSNGLSVEVHLTREAERIVQLSHKASSDPQRSDSSVQEKIFTAKDQGGQEEPHTAEISGEDTCGRPDLPAIIREEASAAASTRGTVGVFVCGPLEMQDDVRNAVADENLNILKSPKSGGMYLHLEHFSWA
ncbi:uncharacterized protein Z520_10776 [Fonsecaea multimorphosa CBS 102226]|uniref:ferric-chelate reductase (NADPH) n=1 Tax=Fonsecaea multimorphosa CBS 102226 TaxID=1442371 RepID=A0A0D2KAR8_9EURO|nr:uncharacterized protein Z520_10776 [Fonsecaea multimorphosa CBS 102226]KIX93598.1 hypothetical protein Z520_10776 [Fonsecaea multimorphosa CBS 102226]